MIGDDADADAILSQGYNHVLCVTLESKEALMLYQDHEDHVHVRDYYIKPLVAGM